MHDSPLARSVRGKTGNNNNKLDRNTAFLGETAVLRLRGTKENRGFSVRNVGVVTGYKSDAGIARAFGVVNNFVANPRAPNTNRF